MKQRRMDYNIGSTMGDRDGCSTPSIEEYGKAYYEDERGNVRGNDLLDLLFLFPFYDEEETTRVPTTKADLGMRVLNNSLLEQIRWECSSAHSCDLNRFITFT